MPIFQVGDLIRWRRSDVDDLHAVGLILEMRAMAPHPAEARVLWNDMPEPRWFFISDLAPVQPDGEHGRIETQGGTNGQVQGW